MTQHSRRSLPLGSPTRELLAIRSGSAKSFQCEAQAPTDKGEPSDEDLRRLSIYRRRLLHRSHREVDPRAEVPRPLDLSLPDQRSGPEVLLTHASSP